MITDITFCDEALMDKLKGFLIDGKEVPVLYINPEAEFKVEEKPAIAIYKAGIYPDNARWTNDLFYDNFVVDTENNLLQVDERIAPDPYVVYYGVRIYYSLQSHGSQLNNHIMRCLRRGSYIKIEGNNYDLQFVSYRNPDATYKDFGEQKENEQREFVEQFLYKLEIEMDSSPRVTKKTSLNLVIGSGLINQEGGN